MSNRTTLTEIFADLNNACEAMRISALKQSEAIARIEVSMAAIRSSGDYLDNSARQISVGSLIQ